MPSDMLSPFSLLPFRCGLRHDGGVHLHWDLLQRRHLHCLLLLFHLHDEPAAMDVLQQPLEHARLQRGGRYRLPAQRQPGQRHHQPGSRCVRGRQPHQEDQPQRGVLEVRTRRTSWAFSHTETTQSAFVKLIFED